MQNAKDSFYLALRDRLAALDPSRTVTVNGIARPAILVVENEVTMADIPPSGVLCLGWLGAQAVAGFEHATQPLMELACQFDYWTEGTQPNAYQDRGRMLAALDAALLQICAPPRTPLMDHTISPAAALGGSVTWTRPVLQPLTLDGRRLRRTAAMKVFAMAEFTC